MTYYGRLASELRYKNYPSHDIAHIIVDAKSHAELSQRDPADEFGIGAEYPKKEKPNRFKVAVTSGYIAVFVAWAAFLLLPLFFSPGSGPRPLVTHIAAIIGFLAVSLVGHLYSYRVPRQDR